MIDTPFLPQTGDSLEKVDFTVEQQPSYTYYLDVDTDKIKGMTKNSDALKQAVYLMLSVERYKYPIYSRNYGVELADLIGMPKDYVMSEVKRRITEALIQDDRINSVDEWEFEWFEKVLKATFSVHSIYGNITITKEVKT